MKVILLLNATSDPKLFENVTLSEPFLMNSGISQYIYQPSCNQLKDSCDVVL